jgi:hypothetical protein
LTGGPPVREAGWAERPGVAVLEGGQLARRAAWLGAAVRDAPDVLVEAGEDRLCLVFGACANAERFSRALAAENVPATADGCRVELRVRPWFSPADLLSLALAVTKVAHYLKH